MTLARPSVSIIVPTLNEEKNISELLDNLAGLGADDIIIADGGSTDRTRELTAGRARLIAGPANRGDQLNRGAAAATGDVLLFLHADVRLEPGALAPLRRAMAHPACPGGNFDIRYAGGDLPARVFTRVNRWRRRLGILYGDSGIFCRRDLFRKLGGFRDYPVLEDYEFARRLAKRGKLALLTEPIHVSDRRWRRAGLPRTLWSWFWIQALYLIGVSPRRLARMYRNVR